MVLNLYQLYGQKIYVYGGDSAEYHQRGLKLKDQFTPDINKPYINLIIETRTQS